MEYVIDIKDSMNAVVGKTPTATTLQAKEPVAPKVNPMVAVKPVVAPVPKIQQKVTVLYHDNCTDGWCSAYLLKKHYPDATLVPVKYGQEPPLVEGGLLIIADFSYSKDQLLDMKSKVDKIVVLDHHETAQDALRGLDFCTFDMNESGASLTAAYIKKLSPSFVVPWFVEYVKDRDLWAWKLTSSRSVSAFIRTFESTVQAWDNLAKISPSSAVSHGEAILSAQEQVIKIILKNGTEVNYEGHKIFVVNSSCYQSEIGEYGYSELGYVFVVVYYIEASGKVNVSLRAKDFNVGKEAKRYGGGGHKLAAGCSFNSLEEFKRQFIR